MGSRFIIKGAVLCLLASMSWGAMFPVAERAMQHIDPFYFSFLRYAFASVLLLIWLVAKEGFKALRLDGQGKAIWFFGTMGFAIYNFGIFWGQNLMGKEGTILASIIEAMIPLISVLILWVLRQGRPANFTLGCILLAFIGGFMVITKGDMSFFREAGSGLIPVLIMFIGVSGWAVYTFGGASFPSWSALRYSALSCLFGSVTAGVCVAILTAFGYLEVPTIQTLLVIKWEMAFMVLIAGIAALISWNLGVKYLTPINAVLFINFAPVTTYIISVLQGYKMSIFDLFGTMIIITALILNNLYQRKKVEQVTPNFSQKLIDNT